jgi:hypothetical protein
LEMQSLSVFLSRFVFRERYLVNRSVLEQS